MIFNPATSVTSRLMAGAAAAAMSLMLSALSARADFRLCNNTGSRVGVALGYKGPEGWTSEGWWNISTHACETLLRGALVARYYYIYAVDYDRGGEWSGQAFMCSREKEFTIRGTGNCLARGYDRTGFFEVDTAKQSSWTVQLTDATAQDQHGQSVLGAPIDLPRTSPPGSVPLTLPVSPRGMRR